MQRTFGSYMAQVAEVGGVEAEGPRVQRITCAVDCGSPVNPNTIDAQVQSAIVYGLTAALRTWMRS
jgi:isoquinoline 1-oxidoreductase beta subunit